MLSAPSSATCQLLVARCTAHAEPRLRLTLHSTPRNKSTHSLITKTAPFTLNASSAVACSLANGVLASSLALPRDELSLSLLSLLSLLELEAAGGGEWRPTVPWALCTGGISSLIASERLAFSASLSLSLSSVTSVSNLCTGGTLVLRQTSLEERKKNLFPLRA